MAIKPHADKAAATQTGEAKRMKARCSSSVWNVFVAMGVLLSVSSEALAR
ncbi:MAG TPA: hypothetical protein VH867_02225 [Burkholderiales bacterium]|jgi:hypothetical protein